MKLNTQNKGLGTSILIGALCALGGAKGYAGTMGPELMISSGKPYVGVFGGAGSSDHFGVKQFGTALFLEGAGGPLAVNAFGTTSSDTVGLVGGHVGYQWPEVSLNFFQALPSIAPAVELEGYYLGKSTFTGHDINNITDRLPEHDFVGRYPTKTGVFLINTVANFNTMMQPRLHPYVGIGIGAGVLSITNATSIQVSPPEIGVNHYNSSTNDSDAAFSAQVKAGLSFELTQNWNIFGEYRWLYLSSTHYTFGSTTYPGHATTTNWLVKFGSQNYNLGAVGIRYSI